MHGSHLLDLTNPTSFIMIELTTIFAGACLLFCIFYRGSKISYPTASAGIPWLGTLVRWNEDAPAFLQSAREKYGDVFRVNLIFFRVTFIVGTEANKFFFRAKDDTLNFFTAMARFSESFLGPGIFSNMEWVAEAWKYITKGFNTPSQLKFYKQTIMQDAEAAFKQWEQKGRVDLFVVVSSLVSQTVLRCMFGDELIDKHGEEIASLIYEIETLSAAPLLFVLPRFPSPPQIRITRARNRLLSLFDGNIADRIDNPEKWRDSHDYIQTVLNDNGAIWQRYLGLHTLSVALAAFTNTAGTMGWTIASIAADQSILKKVVQEVDSNPMDGDVINSLNSLPFLDCCMKETVRKYSLLMALRTAEQDITFNGHVIPKGEIVSISPLLVHRDPAIFPDPNAYKPERFAEKVTLEKVNREMEFVQFGHLKHRCLGERFANLVLKSVWHMLFSEYDVELEAPLPEADFTKAAGTPFPKAPIMVRISHRLAQDRTLSVRASGKSRVNGTVVVAAETFVREE
ncbi:cytochrome P450 [Fimicolochytrium jonesii]|uniref:cytochrome P450 n=1 Tax=Fimicolochytrium jonesii TaxID=1396493 RepID=UPI0022FE14BA|nr:cytochrome P450 [Fimicolochytrium jonesii]KAI8826965.1 cytochrome P450 [Fimicolochytrium jonesii]